MRVRLAEPRQRQSRIQNLRRERRRATRQRTRPLMVCTPRQAPHERRIATRPTFLDERRERPDIIVPLHERRLDSLERTLLFFVA